jgi:hypothetical protein
MVNNFYWVLVNLATPIFAPIFMMALSYVTQERSKVTRWIRNSLSDGQLLWTAICIAATAAYDVGYRIWVELGPHVVILHFLLLVFLGLIFTASVVVKEASVIALNYEDSVKEALQSSSPLPEKPASRVYVTSIAFTAGISILYLIVKFGLAHKP